MIFHKEFFPTPNAVLELMQIDCKNKIILEPHAGKGDIVDFVINNGAKEVLAFEINTDLQKIVQNKCSLIGSDFFDCIEEQISHIDQIIMNPPFSNADDHIIHAWKIAPEGCEIIALCNYETIVKDYNHRELIRLINDYGISQNLGTCFDNAERKTNVEIGLIRLFKPVRSENFDFNGFFMDDEEDDEICGEGILPYNEVKALVNRYVGIMKTFDLMKLQIDNMNYSIKQIGMSSIDLKIGYNDNITSKERFSKTIQKSSWNHIFNKMNLTKYVTSGVMKDINKFVEQQEKYPFTMKNIYRMFEIIVGTRQDTFNRALEEAIDNFTKHSHENRFGVEGWKTNSGYMLNKKFIVENITESNWGFRIKYNSYNGEKIDDLTKVLCNITATDYNNIGGIYRFNYDGDSKQISLEPNTWYEWGFFEVKFFKKGTMHVKFKDIDVWYKLNKAYGELKGFVLPENYNK